MGFHQQLEAEEMSVHPKATPLRAGLPNFHPAVPGAAARAAPSLCPAPLEEKQSQSCKTPHPCLLLAGRSPETPGWITSGASAGLSRQKGPGIHLWGKHNSAELLQHSWNTGWVPWECCSRARSKHRVVAESSHESFQFFHAALVSQRSHRSPK